MANNRSTAIPTIQRSIGAVCHYMGAYVPEHDSSAAVATATNERKTAWQ